MGEKKKRASRHIIRSTFLQDIYQIYLIFLRSKVQPAILPTPGSLPVNIVPDSLSFLSHQLSHAVATFA